MKLESGPEKPFTIERAEEIRQEIEEVLALIKSGKVLGKDFEEKLKGLKKDLLELVRHHIIRREIITKIDIIINLLKQYNNLLKSQQEKKLENLKNQINSLLEELKTGLSHILEVLERVFLDNLKNFLLNLHLAKSALEDPEVWKFSPRRFARKRYFALYLSNYRACVKRIS
jgi:Mg2+ and Co2+ transporter CorA